MKNETASQIMFAISLLRQAGEILREASLDLASDDIDFAKLASLTEEEIPAAFETGVIRACVVAGNRDSFKMADRLSLVMRTRNGWKCKKEDGMSVIGLTEASGVELTELFMSIPMLAEMMISVSEGKCDCPACQRRDDDIKKSMN